MEKNVDICIVGGSGAGLSAAITAKQSGAKSVLVLEKRKRTGGCTQLCGGLFGIGTPVQERKGLDYDKEYYPIEGLLGAGVLTSGWLAGVYAFFGSELSYTIYSGRAAGEEAAKYTEGK